MQWLQMPEEVSELRELKLMIISHHVTLGAKAGSSERALKALNHGVISPAIAKIFFSNTMAFNLGEDTIENN